MMNNISQKVKDIEDEITYINKQIHQLDSFEMGSKMLLLHRSSNRVAINVNKEDLKEGVFKKKKEKLQQRRRDLQTKIAIIKQIIND